MCGLRYGLVDSTSPYPLMPASVVIRTTGFCPKTVHLRSVIFIYSFSYAFYAKQRQWDCACCAIPLYQTTRISFHPQRQVLFQPLDGLLQSPVDRLLLLRIRDPADIDAAV